MAADDALAHGFGRDGIAIGLDRTDVLRDELVCDERADAIVDQDDVARIRRFLHRDEAVVNGIMPRGTARHDRRDFFQHVLVDVRPELVDPAFETDDDDLADLGMALEFLQRIEDDGTAMHHEELLWARTGVHAAPRAASENEDFDHSCFFHSSLHPWRIRIRHGCRSSGTARAFQPPA